MEDFFISLFSSSEDGSSSITERLYDKIKGNILDGTLPSGFVMPNENEMCQLLQVGRSTLREAYKILSTNGLITRTKTGTYINSYDTIIRSAPLSIVAELASFDDIFGFRLMFEAECARCAGERIKDEEILVLSDIIKKAKQTNDVNELRELDLLFHRSVVEFSHNPLLVCLFPSVWNAFESLLVENYGRLSISSPEMLNNATQHHQAILSALMSHDEDSAKVLMQKHLLKVYEKI